MENMNMNEEYKQVVEYIRTYKVSMMVATKKFNVRYTTFSNWTRKQKDLKEELRQIKINATKEKYERAIRLILEETITITESARRVGVNKDVLCNYIQKNKNEHIKRQIKYKIEKARIMNKKPYRKKIKNKSSKTKKTESEVLRIFLQQDKNKPIRINYMLDILIENNIDTPRFMFTKILEKKGYKII